MNDTLDANVNLLKLEYVTGKPAVGHVVMSYLCNAIYGNGLPK